MIHLAHRPRIRGVKRLPRDEVHVGILVSLHLCVRAVLAKIVLFMQGEAPLRQLIVAQLELRQVPVSQSCSHFVNTVGAWCARAPHAVSASRPLCNLHVRSGNSCSALLFG